MPMDLKAATSHLEIPQATATRFSSAARDYDQHARIQKHAALHLCNWLDQMLPENFAPKACVDVGSGTGFLTEYLLNKFPQRPVHAVDLAKGMLTELERKCPNTHLHTHQLDGETLSVEHLWIPSQSLLVSGMCAQWFSQIEEAIRRWLSVSNTVAFSVLQDGSFQAWHAAHEESQQTCGLQPLPNSEQMHGMLDTFVKEGLVVNAAQHTKEFLDHHPDGLSFARSLRAIGADMPRKNHNPVNLRKVIAALGDGCTMNYQIGFYYLERP